MLCLPTVFPHQSVEMMPSVDRFEKSPEAKGRGAQLFQKLYPKLPPVPLPPCGQFVERCHVLHVEGDVAYVTWDELLQADDFSCPILQRLRGEPEENYEALSLEPGNLCLQFLNESDLEVRRCNIEWVSIDGQEIQLRYVDCGTSTRSSIDELRLTALPKSAMKHIPMAIRVSFDIPTKGTAFLAPTDAVDRGPGKKRMKSVPVVNTATLALEMADLLRNAMEVDMYIVDLDDAEDNVPNVIFQVQGQALSLVALDNIARRRTDRLNIVATVGVTMTGGNLHEEDNLVSPLRQSSRTEAVNGKRRVKHIRKPNVYGNSCSDGVYLQEEASETKKRLTGESTQDQQEYLTQAYNQHHGGGEMPPDSTTAEEQYAKLDDDHSLHRNSELHGLSEQEFAEQLMLTENAEWTKPQATIEGQKELHGEQLEQLYAQDGYTEAPAVGHAEYDKQPPDIPDALDYVGQSFDEQAYEQVYAEETSPPQAYTEDQKGHAFEYSHEEYSSEHTGVEAGYPNKPVDGLTQIEQKYAVQHYASGDHSGTQCYTAVGQWNSALEANQQYVEEYVNQAYDEEVAYDTETYAGQNYAPVKEYGDAQEYATPTGLEQHPEGVIIQDQEKFYATATYADTGETYAAQEYTQGGYVAITELPSELTGDAPSYGRQYSQAKADVQAGGFDATDTSRLEDPFAPGALWFGRVSSVIGFAEVNIIPTVSQETLYQLEIQLAYECETLPVGSGCASTNQLVVAFVSERRGCRARLIQRLTNGAAKVWLLDYEHMATARKVALLPAHLCPNEIPPFVVKVSPSRQQSSGVKFADYKRLLEETSPDVFVRCFADDANGRSDIRLFTEDGTDVFDAYDVRTDHNRS